MVDRAQEPWGCLEVVQWTLKAAHQDAHLLDYRLRNESWSDAIRSRTGSEGLGLRDKDLRRLSLMKRWTIYR